MNVDSLKQAIEALSADERRQLISFAIDIQMREEPAYREALIKQIDERDPAAWVSINEVDQRFEIDVPAETED